MIDTHHGWNASTKPLLLGFTFSIILTLSIYRIATHMHLRHDWLVWTAIGMGALQIILQLLFFLHLGLEAKPKWNALMFLFTLILALIVVLGTLWIMNNMDYNLMPQMAAI